MTLKISPFAPAKFPDLPPIMGIDMAVANAGLRYQGRDDLWLLRGQAGSQVAGVFTQSQTPGSPVIWSRKALTHPVSDKAPRLILVNSGVANVFCGKEGDEAAKSCAVSTAHMFGGDAQNIFLASTGVIGEPLDASKILACLPEMKKTMSHNIWEASARAIMTTDTYAKGAHITTSIDDVPVHINGIAKGSGMIAPNMATMLAFLATDARITQTALQDLLSELTATTFNAVTVDGDTSTSDMVLCLSSNQAQHPLISDISDPRLMAFKTALEALMLDLAHQIVKDGEGASKFISVHIQGAHSDTSARQVAMAIANSPLVKTAIAGEDANWGRIIMAIGKTGEPIDPHKLTLSLGPHLITHQGQLNKNYSEDDGSTYMTRSEIDIHVDLGLGSGQFTAWSCDLTHQYININADYRN